jgi:hypothetical protein
VVGPPSYPSLAAAAIFGDSIMFNHGIVSTITEIASVGKKSLCISFGPHSRTCRRSTLFAKA